MLPPNSAQIRDLMSMDGDAQRGWLVANQPPAESERFSWWEVVSTSALGGLYDSAPSSAEGLQYALLATRSTEEAMAQHVLDRTSGLIRLGHLASWYGGHNANDVHQVVDPDKLVQECLALFEVPFASASLAASNWQTLPLAEIRALRKVKNILGAITGLTQYIRDHELVNNVNRWLEIRDRLP